MTDKIRDSRTDFPTTSWKLIRDTQDLSADQRGGALEQLLRKYWKPIYAYFRGKGKTRHDAEELVQGFLCDFLRNEAILCVDENVGRFRTWLRACLDNFLVSSHRKADALKRRPPGGILSLEQLEASDGLRFEPADATDPDAALVQAWRRDVLQKALQSVAVECKANGRQLHFQVFAAYYCDTTHAKVTWKEIAERFGLPDWKDAAHKADWVKRQLGQAIRRQIAEYTESYDEIDEEIQELC